MRIFIALGVGLLIGVLIGMVSERQLYNPTLTCPEIPSCPLIPECPIVQLDQTSLNFCLKTVGSLVDKNNKIVSEHDDCTLNLSLCNSEARFWQEKYSDFNCD
jgi:hypothetical protein